MNKEISINEEIMQPYIFLASVVDCFIDLKPEHPLYESFRKDILDCLKKIKGQK